jgi:hypothetical protein
MNTMDTLTSQKVVQADPDPQTRKRKIHCKQELIIASLQKFYGDRVGQSEEILALLQGTSPISLRLVDWFVTNYAKQKNTSYILNGQEFLVYMNYKSQLKAYSKKLFDPFCRRERILFQMPGQPPFMTTVGKLNFFRWAIEKGVLDYIRLNLTSLEREMNATQREMQRARRLTEKVGATTTPVPKVGATRRRTRVQTAGSHPITSKVMQKHDLEVKVSFD